MPTVNKVTFNGNTIMDISDTTAVAADVAEGKYFYNSNGIKTAGTFNVDPDDWVRPSNYPDYSKLDLTGQEVVYFSVDVNAIETPFIYLSFSGTNVTIDKGVLSNGSFTVSSNVTTISGNNIWVTDVIENSDPKDSNGFVVYRVSGTITNIQHSGIQTTINEYKTYSIKQPIVEIYGRLPNVTAIRFRGIKSLESVSLFDCAEITSMERAFNETDSLKNVKITGLTKVTSMYMTFTDSFLLKVIDLDGYETTGLTSAYSIFQYCRSLKKVNAIFDFSSITNSNSLSMFQACYGYNNIIIKNGFGSGYNQSCANLFNSCPIKYFDGDGWHFDNVTNISNMFYSDNFLDEVDLSNANFSSVTNANSMFYNSYSVRIIKLPATLSVVGTSMFQNCQSLQELHFGSTTPPTCTNTNTWNYIPNTVKIYVPYSEDHSVLAAYQSATNWGNVTSYLVEEEP